jgi:hypothetical protein
MIHPLFFLAWVGLSAAQTPPSSAPAAEEVVVWGEHHVRQARAAVIRAVEDLGWRARSKRREGVVVFRPPEAWMGRAHFTPSGELLFKRPVLAVEPALVPGNTESYDSDAVLDRMDSSGISAGPGMTILPSEKRVLAAQERLRVAIQEPLDAYVSLYRVTGFRTLLAELPERLDQLWLAGQPLDGGEILVESTKDRRLVVLSYWGSQPDNADGIAVSTSVEAWIRETVQRSESPFSETEIAAAETLRGDGRTLADRIQLK